MNTLFFFRYRQWVLVLLLAVVQGCAYSQGEKDSVCITRTGEKYHRCSCHYLRFSKFEVTLREAAKRGYKPCIVCKPPRTDDSQEPSTITPVPAVKTPPRNTELDVQEKQTTSSQCTATTKSGSRCKRTTTSANGRCWQHQ